VLFWSVIAAAFIGPGTVTTAASAGAGHGYSLLWALGFSTVACLVLQEAAGRLRLLSGASLGTALRRQFPTGGSRWLVLVVVLGAVLVGNAAYEAGNILGAVSGASLVLGVPGWILTLACCVLAALLLWFNAPSRVAQVLAVAVAVMGVAFFWMALMMGPSPAALARGLLVPTLPAGSGLLALGLVGTTVVPYNLFLGSGIGRDEELPVFRFGLAVAVLLGGGISMAILVVGTELAPPFSFEGLSAVLETRLGSWAGALFALGLFAAGLSSAVTAPLASALTARSILSPEEGAQWAPGGWAYRTAWGGVLATGLAFGLSGVRPVPVIVLAQALNGVLLPGVAIFLLIAVNDRRLMGSRGLNGWLSNAAMVVVTLVALQLGLLAIARVVAGLAGADEPGLGLLAGVAGGSAALLAIPVARLLRRVRGGEMDERMIA
jgi:Mn2+/Fe2+ NRAMP family transporter